MNEQAATEARVAALHQITAAVTSTLDLHAVLKVLMEKMDIFLPYSAIQVWLMNAESGVLERAACRNLDEAEWKRRQLKNTPALVKEAMDSRAPVVVRNVQTDARTLDPAFYRNQGIVSYLGLPLVVKDEVLGVLVTLTRQEHQFSPAEIEFLSTVAGQAAIGIHNSQLYEQTTKQTAELERAYKELKNKEEIQALLKDLNQDITRLDIDSLFRNLTEKVREILRVDISDVRVLVEGEWKLTGITGIDPNLLTSGRSGTGRGPAGWIQQHRQPLVIPDLAHTEVPVGSTMKSLGIHGYVGVPLFSRGGEVIGVLRGLSYQPRNFTQEEVELLQLLASGSGVALENAKLLDEIKCQAVALERSNEAKDELMQVMARQKEELARLNAGLQSEIAERAKARAEIAAKNRDLETLHEIGQIILTSPDDKTTLEKILHHALTAGACDIGSIRLLDAETQTLDLVGHSGYRHVDSINAHHRNIGEATSGRHTLAMVTEPRPHIVENVQQGEGLRTFKKEGVRSAIIVPVRNQDKVLGALQLGSRAGRKFQPEQIRFLEAIGNQMGIAVEKARLFDEIKKQTLELEKSNKTKDELLAAMASQKEELSRLNAGLRREIAERTKARAEIAAKNRDLETLLYVTSHDLREPLRAIENFSRIVNDRYGERLDEKGQDFLRRVIQGSQRLTQLLDDILMLSRSQRMGVPTEAVAGETIVQEALKRLEGKVSATNAQVHVASEFGGLRVDKTWATQAVYNLLVNALKFTRDGAAPDVEIAPYSLEGSGSGVVGIAVRDRGPGVSPEHAERIFQLFQRAVGREVEGTGAGLAIVRQIAERHGGNAWVEPRAGGGSQFVITFGQSEGVQGGSRNEC
jgi:GAF domain-containing protein